MQVGTVLHEGVHTSHNKTQQKIYIEKNLVMLYFQELWHKTGYQSPGGFEQVFVSLPSAGTPAKYRLQPALPYPGHLLLWILVY